MAPTASASGVLNVPPAAVPTTIDFSGAASCVAGFETPTVIASTADGVVFCGLATPRACYALSYATGTFHRFDASHPEPPTTVSSAGRHLLEARRGAIVVCERDAAGTRREPCTTLDVGAFAADAKVPADVSQDGTKVVVVREVGGEAHGFTVDIYDLATRRRLKRFGLKGQEHVSHVRWPGQRIFVSDCVAAGPGCTPLLVDPDTEKATRPGDVNVFAVENAAQQANGPLWGFVDSTGSTIALADVDTGVKKATLHVPLASEVLSGVAVARRQGSEIVIVSGAPRPGQAVLVDLSSGKIGRNYTPKPCK